MKVRIGKCRICGAEFEKPPTGRRELCDECRATHGKRKYKEDAEVDEPGYVRYHRYLNAFLGIKRRYW